MLDIGVKALVQTLLAHGADPNIARLGTTCLHIAVARKNLTACSLLLSSAADPMCHDKLHCTCMDVTHESQPHVLDYKCMRTCARLCMRTDCWSWAQIAVQQGFMHLLEPLLPTKVSANLVLLGDPAIPMLHHTETQFNFYLPDAKTSSIAKNKRI